MRWTRHLLTAFDRPGMPGTWRSDKSSVGFVRFLESVASLCRWVVKPDEVHGVRHEGQIEVVTFIGKRSSPASSRRM
jgi:hypothetical protein